MPSQQVRDRDTRLRFFENPDDLTLRELRFPHDRSFGREQSTFECLPRGEAYGCTQTSVKRGNQSDAAPLFKQPMKHVGPQVVIVDRSAGQSGGR